MKEVIDTTEQWLDSVKACDTFDVEKHYGSLRVLSAESIYAMLRSSFQHGYVQGRLTARTHAPPGCHCTTKCMAPVVMGRQTPCRDPDRFTRAALPTGAPLNSGE